MKTVYSPGCALLLYKPELAERIFQTLKGIYSDISLHTICCHHEPKLDTPALIINTCPGCDRRFGALYKGVSTVSLWEVLAENNIPLPKHTGLRASILDACPTRKNVKVHKAVRTLLNRMDISVSEPEHTGTKGKCCGDSFYGRLPKEDVISKMKARADEMPEENVAVYCVSCVKSMKNGGKNPLYLPDLLFSEKTEAGDCDPDSWHSLINNFIETH